MIPPFPWPQANEVHIHCTALATDTARYLSPYLSPDEMLRADCLLDPHKRMLFIASRGLLREILGRYLGIPAEGLHFTVGPHGKPFLSAFTDTNRQLHFNLSHSGDLFLLAIATDCEVGIDVEQLRMETPILDMARLAFSPCEQKELQSLPHHLQRRAFFRGWTRKEAYLKACGMGFDLPSNSFDVSLSPETPAAMIAPNDLSRWRLHDIRVPDGYCAALAVKGSIPIIRYMD